MRVQGSGLRSTDESFGLNLSAVGGGDELLREGYQFRHVPRVIPPARERERVREREIFSVSEGEREKVYERKRDMQTDRQTEAQRERGGNSIWVLWAGAMNCCESVSVSECECKSE